MLPGLNLMLDVPALALGLLGYALFVLACERPDARIALASGLVLGLAMQTKYSAVVYPALVLVHAAIYRRPREGAVALLAAAGLFVGWESLLFARYQQSHLLAGIERLQTLELLPALAASRSRDAGEQRALLDALPALAAGRHAALPGSARGGGSRREAHPRAGGGAIAAARVRRDRRAAAPARLRGRGLLRRALRLLPELFVFVPLGLCVAIAIGCAAARSLRGGASSDPRVDRVLVAWLLLEIVGYFAISPYPAVRRVIGLGVAAALLAARAACQARRCSRTPAPAAQIAAAFGVALGLLYFGSDLADAIARRAAIARAEQRLTQLGADRTRETLWYNGHWELQFYAEEAGMHAVVAGESQLRPRDWLLLTENTTQPPISFPADRFREEDELLAMSRSPWSTMPLYYDGPVPLRRQPEFQARARIFRVTRDWVSQVRVSPP